MRQFYPEVSEISAQSSILPGCDAKTKSYEASTLITKLYFIMPLVVGCTLDVDIRANHTLIFVTATINAVIKGLKILHDENVGHGDVKPDNIVFNRQTMTASFIDFGFAGQINESGECKYDMKDRVVENMSYTVGTKLYAAPETMSYFDELTGENILKSDIYSLGASILQLLCLGDDEFSHFEPWFDPSLSEIASVLGERKRYKYTLVSEKFSHQLVNMMIIFLERMTAIDPVKRPTIDTVLDQFTIWSEMLITALVVEIKTQFESELKNNTSLNETDKGLLKELISKLSDKISTYEELSKALQLSQNLAETSQIPNIIERIYQQCLNKLKMNPTNSQKSSPEINLTYSRK